MDDMYIGKHLDSRFEIVEKIGSGGMAVVYKALDHRLNRHVAIKILKSDLAQDPELRRRFHAESQAVAMLSHPNIVSVYDVNHSDNVDYIVMELIEGITLKQYINRKGILNWKEVLHFTTQIAKALEHAHSRGIVHRDIKPHNIMILKDGNVKVADFGIARLLTTKNTLTQQALGSVHYISPEQAKGSAVDARSDIYSLGVVMYEMLTSRLPFEGDSAVSVAIQHISSIPLQPREINPDIPVGLEEITMKAMSPALSARYQSAAELLEDLEDFRKNPSLRFNYSMIPSMADDSDATKQIIPIRNVSEMERVRRQVSGNGATRNRVSAEEYRKNRSRSGRTTMLVGTFCVVILLALLAYFMWDVAIKDWLMPETKQKIDIPPLVGMNISQVEDNRDYTLYYRFNVKYDKNSDKPEGYILEQDPRPGSTMTLTDEGVLITLTVSAGPEEILMPDIINMDYRDAEYALKNLGIELNITLKDEYNDTYTSGYVFNQIPAKDTVLTPGMEVIIYYSKGPEVAKVPVPDLFGLTEATAMSRLEAEGLKGKVVEEYDDVNPKGRVFFQNYQKDFEVPLGTEVEFFISLGPDPNASTAPPTEGNNPTEPPDNPTEPPDNPTEPADNPTEPPDNPTEPPDNPTDQPGGEGPEFGGDEGIEPNG